MDEDEENTTAETFIFVVEWKHVGDDHTPNVPQDKMTNSACDSRHLRRKPESHNFRKLSKTGGLVQGRGCAKTRLGKRVTCMSEPFMDVDQRCNFGSLPSGNDGSCAPGLYPQFSQHCLDKPSCLEMQQDKGNSKYPCCRIQVHILSASWLGCCIHICSMFCFVGEVCNTVFVQNSCETFKYLEPSSGF